MHEAVPADRAGGAQPKRPVKQALIAVVTRDSAAISAVTAQELADGFAFLDVLPLSDTEIAQEQARSRKTWAALQDAIARDEIDPA